MWRSSLYTTVSVVGVIAIATTCCAVPLGRWTCSPEYTVTECVESISAAPQWGKKETRFTSFAFGLVESFSLCTTDFFCAFAFGFGLQQHHLMSECIVLFVFGWWICCLQAAARQKPDTEQLENPKRSPLLGRWAPPPSVSSAANGKNCRVMKTFFFSRNLHNWGISMWIVES